MKRLFLKTGDLVKVLSGDDKGKSGLIIKMYPKTRRALVRGVNMVTKHVKADKQNGTPGRIDKVEAPIHICKLMYLDSNSNVGSRIGWKIGEDGKKCRYLKKNGLTI